MRAIRTIIFGTGAIALFAFAGCESDLTADNSRIRPGRALESPVERNSASGEIANATDMSGVPLVDVGLPNGRNQPPTVRTIVDNVFQPPATKPPATTIPTSPTGATIGGAATRPTTAPATQPGAVIDPLLGPRE